MTVFLDLDGTILDVKRRYCRLYRDMLDKGGFRFLPDDEYWKAKRCKMPERVILEKTGAESHSTEYERMRLDLLESREYLALDSPHVGSVDLLKELKEDHDLVVVTLRRSRDNLEWQLDSLGISSLFKAVLSSSQERTPQWMIKHDIIADYLGGGRSEDHMMVGDTDTDILAGQELGFATVAVLSGIRNRKILGGVNPDHMIRSITGLPDVMGSW